MTAILKISYVLVLFSTLFYLFSPLYAPYVMALGGAGIAVSHLRELYEGKNLRLRRIYRTRRMVAILFLAASFFMFRPGMYWVLLLLISVLLELYTIYVVDHEMKKEQ